MSGKRIHLVGIKGVGMTGVATILQESGNTVSGSDTAEEFFTDRILAELGIPVLPFAAKNITPEFDEIIFSTAYIDDHEEIARAKDLNIPTRSYTQFLAEMFNEKKGILITGTHGKTSTTAMVGRILEDAGYDPTVLVGGEVNAWGRTARSGKGEWMVIEGDEYQAKILEMKPWAVVVTNIEYDHPDFYKTTDDYEKVFADMIHNMKGDGIVVTGEGTEQLSVYGSSLKDRTFQVYAPLDINFEYVYGEHNKLNAGAAAALARELGIADEQVETTLRAFKGTKRRLETYSLPGANPIVVDDYAHHPTEVIAALRALRKKFANYHLVAVFQPHTYTRTAALLKEFGAAFMQANEVFIPGIYGSAREEQGRVSAADLASEIQKNGREAHACENLDEVVALLQKRTYTKPTVVVTIGAGDVWQIARELTATPRG